MTKIGWPATSMAAVCCHFCESITKTRCWPTAGTKVWLPATVQPSVGHLVYRQLLLTAPVAVEDALHATLGMPEINLGHAVLAEQAGDVVAAFRGQQRVVGLTADAFEAGDPWLIAPLKSSSQVSSVSNRL